MEKEFQWLEGLTVWMEEVEPLRHETTVIQLNEAWGQTVLETDALLQQCSTLETAFSQIATNHMHNPV